MRNQIKRIVLLTMKGLSFLIRGTVFLIVLPFCLPVGIVIGVIRYLNRYKDIVEFVESPIDITVQGSYSICSACSIINMLKYFNIYNDENPLDVFNGILKFEHGEDYVATSIKETNGAKMVDCSMYINVNFKELEAEYHNGLFGSLLNFSSNALSLEDNQVNIIKVESAKLYNQKNMSGYHALLLYKIEDGYAYMIDSNLKLKAIRIKCIDLESILAYEYISVKLNKTVA